MSDVPRAAMCPPEQWQSAASSSCPLCRKAFPNPPTTNDDGEESKRNCHFCGKIVCNDCSQGKLGVANDPTPFTFAACKACVLKANDTKNESLRTAAGSGDVEQIKTLVQSGAEVNAANPSGYPPLYFAITNNREEAVKALIVHGANVNATWPSYGGSALHTAIYYSRVSMISALLDAGASVSAPDPSGNGPLYSVVLRGLESATKDLLQRGADVKALSSSRETILHAAARSGSAPLIKQFLDAREIQIDAVNNRGETALYFVVANNREAAAKELIDRGASLNVVTTTRQTLLHVAKSATMIQSLIQAGANVNAVDSSGQSPLYMAVVNNSEALVKELVKLGANAKLAATNGWTPLHYAACNNSTSLVVILLEAGAAVDALDAAGQSPLFVAAQYNRELAAKELIRLGASLNVVATNRQTLMHAAAYGGCMFLLPLLKQSGVDVNGSDSSGQTPLYVASSRGGAAAVKELLNLGASAKTVASNVWTALHAATRAGSAPSIILLVEAGAEVDATDKTGLPPLMLAAQYNYQAAAAELLRLGANAKYVCANNGQTPLHVAASIGSVPVVKMLLEHGADADAQNKQGQTPIQMASGAPVLEILTNRRSA